MGKKGLKSRKRREQTIAIIIVAAIVLVLTAVILIFIASKNDDLGHDHEHGSGTKAELNLKVSLAEGKTSIHYASLEVFKEEVEKRSNGKITVSIYESEQLGTDVSVIDSMVNGKKTADIVVSDVSNFMKLDSRMDISALPFLFESHEEAWAFMSGDIQGEIEKNLIAQNVRVLTHYSDGFEHILANKAVSKADELTGLKVSSIDSKFTSAVLKSLGAQPLLGNESSVYSAVQKNEANAYIGKLEPIVNYHLYETQRYLSMTYYKYHAMAFAICEETWKSLTQEQQSIITSAAEASANADVKTMKLTEENTIAKLENFGLKVVRPNLSSFTQKAAAVIRGYQSQYDPYTDRVINEYMK